jgi:hypothetical protein
LNLAKILNLLRNTGPFGNAVNVQSFNLMASIIAGLVQSDHLDDAYRLIKVFKNPINRSSLYAFAANELLQQKINGPAVEHLMDSARIELTRIKSLSTGQPNRQLIAHALAMQDPWKNGPEAYKTIKNIGNKFDPSLRITRAFAFHGDLFGAQQQIIQNISDGDQARFLWNILYGYSQGKNENKSEWKQYNEIQQIGNRFIGYVNENN